MTNGLEQELKCSLSADAYLAVESQLCGLLGDPQRLDQENHFYDTASGALQAARKAIRLRRENQRLVLTCKQQAGHRQMMHHEQLEWERDLNLALWPQLRDHPQWLPSCVPLPNHIRAEIQGQSLAEFGSFSNLRLRWDLDSSAHLALDCTNFGSRIDYELEIEADPSYYQHWIDHLRDWHIPWHEQTLTKLHRFIRYRHG